MKKIQITLILLLAASTFLFAQKEEGFTPGGKPFAKIYTNFNYTSSGESGSPAFEIKRAYLGYEYAFSPVFSAKINIDVDNPGVGKLQLTAFLKNAYMHYQKNKLTVQFGMISTTAFKVQEDFWGKRWIYKSFQDEHKYSASADIGFSAAYKILSFASMDVAVVNGEGYKTIQSDGILKTALGLTLTPFKNLTARIYVDQMKDESAQQTLATFVGYKTKKFSVAGEYNIQKNRNMVSGEDFTGLSFYTSVPLFHGISFFGRFDQLDSAIQEGTELPWNLSTDGQLFMAGFEFSPVNGLKIGPGFHGWKPADSNQDFVNGFYLNFEYKF